ncbi:MAG: sigma 54-interacting transcriptional regulator, partial [Bacilli bacterium]|nr:sigma 54-interacting transcriptional regulator [Bacilli bacterium]
VHLIDKVGKTILYNDSMEKIEKLSKEYIMSKSFLDIVDEMNIKNSTLLEVLNKKEAIKNNMQRYVDKNGKEVITINTTIPIMNKNEFIGALEISKDVTAVETLSEEIMDLKKNKNKKVNRQEKRYRFEDIIGNSKVMKESIDKCKKASKSDASILIYGETGTGKELISQSIHYASGRKEYPFIAQNCAALPESLFEGILFGTAKGGFTGAVDRPGLFEQANKGTLLLDEINSMPMSLQAKLLRVLQEGYVRRVGGSKDIPVDVRVIATTNENTNKILNENKMRKDLYYRLSVINIEIPPLRERKEDISLLCDKFIKKYNEKLNKNIKGISYEAIDYLKIHSWQGNVRELENIIYSAMSMMEDEIHIDSNMIFINDYYSIKEKKANETYSLEDLENKTLDHIIGDIEEGYIIQSLEKTGYNISKSAAILGINRQNLQYKMKKYNIKNFNR